MQDIDTFKLLLFFCNTFVILLILNNGITTCASHLGPTRGHQQHYKGNLKMTSKIFKIRQNKY